MDPRDNKAQQHELFSLYDVVAALQEPALLVDRQLKIAAVNDRAEWLFNLPPGQAVGKPFMQAVDKPQVCSVLENALAEGYKKDSSFEENTFFTRVGQDSFFFKITAHPMKNDGGVACVLATFCDITSFKELEKMKTDFVAVVSHELRTPLTSVMMGVDMLKDGHLGEISPKGKEILEAVAGDCSRLLRLINNLLDLSRMEEGIITMEKDAVEVEELVEYSIDALRFQAKKRGVNLYSSPSHGLPPIAADFNKASFVITNLIGNALRYTNQGGEVVLDAERKGARVFIRVKDTGIGISPAYHEKIFDKFQQVPGGKKRKTGGAGLGLSISREIMDAHGGTIWVESEPGEGSTFTCAFPVYRG